MPDVATVERSGPTAIVHLRGDVAITTARQLHATLRSLRRRREVKAVVLECGALGRLDSAGVAVIELARRSLERAGKQLRLEHVGEAQRGALALAPATVQDRPPGEEPTRLEIVGERVLALLASARGAAQLALEVIRQGLAVVTRRRKLPAGAITGHVLTMGADAVFIVGLLAFLLGVTTAFQGVMQLTKFGAGVYVADMVGWSMIRELAPLITAVVLTGRTGAAIAAELGAMRVGQEIDALTAMGISPVRFLVVPRLAALTFALPALTLIAMFVSISGGALVGMLLLDMSPATFWLRIVQRVDMADFVQGFSKSFVFAWIIGLTGSHLGLRASGDATSVGTATTRAVVVSIFFIIVVDAMFASVISTWETP